MPMSAEDVSKVTAWQAKHERLMQCDICEGPLKVDSEIVSESSLYIKQNEAPLPSVHLPQTKTFKLIAVTCASCGQVKFIDASVVGVIS